MNHCQLFLEKHVIKQNQANMNMFPITNQPITNHQLPVAGRMLARYTH